MKTRLALLCVWVGLVSCQPSLERRAARFERDIETVREQLHNSGLAVVYVENNQIVYTHSFGYKNVERQEPLTDDCMFRIASISKSFTTTSLLQLVEQGKVSLDTDVSDLVGFSIRHPRYPDIPITLEMLLSHTSSLNDDQGYFTLDIINPATNPNVDSCFNDYAPGAGYEYCNLNLNLAGTILERLSGERFDQYVVHHILDPLGLYGGYYTDSLDRSRLASLYEDGVCVDSEAYASWSLEGYRMGYDTPKFSPTGGMKLSATDLAKYMLMHMNYGTTPDGVRILSEASSRNMQTPRSDDEHYGLSLWKTDEYTGDTLVGHTGSAYGMRSGMFFDPVEKFGFVVISGGADSDSRILRSTMEWMYRHFRNKKSR